MESWNKLCAPTPVIENCMVQDKTYVIYLNVAKTFGIKFLHDQGGILFSLLLKSRQFIS